MSRGKHVKAKERGQILVLYNNTRPRCVSDYGACKEVAKILKRRGLSRDLRTIMRIVKDDLAQQQKGWGVRLKVTSSSHIPSSASDLIRPVIILPEIE